MLPLLFASALAAAPPDAALAAFTLDLQEDGLVDPTGTRTEALLDEACAAGHALSCSARPLPRGSAEALHPLAQAACAAGDPLGCAVAGWTLPEDAPAGADLALYTRSCTEEFPRGCAEQGAAEYRAGDKDGGRARAMAACEAGSGNACLVAAWGLEGPEEDAREERGCALGDQASCYQVAWRRWKKGSKDPDPARGFALFSAACEAGHGRACYRVAQDYEDGQRTQRQDLVAAAENHERACSLGYESGCFSAAYLLSRGVLGERRVGEGERMLAERCEAESGSACMHLAAIELGRAARVGNTDAAWTHLERGCGLGHGSSCYVKGLAEYAGLHGGEPDPAAALETLQVACFEHEHAASCLPLARLRAERGEDPKPTWAQACALGADPACKARETGAGPFLWFRRTVDPVPRTKLTRGSRNLRAQDRVQDLVRNAWVAPPAFLRARTVETLLADAGPSADPARLAPWAPALAAACSVDAPDVCAALGELRMQGDDPAGAAQAWGEGCGVGAARRDNCAALVGVLDTHGRALDKDLRHTAAVTLCSARRGDWCKAAAKGFRGGDSDRALEMYAHGCAVKHADSCKQVERSTGAPMAEPPLARGGGPGPKAHGDLQTGVFLRALLRRRPALQRCFGDLLADDPDAVGSVLFGLEILPNGKLGEISAESKTLDDEDFLRCAKAAVRPATFPRPQGGGVVLIRTSFRFLQDGKITVAGQAGPE